MSSAGTSNSESSAVLVIEVSTFCIKSGFSETSHWKTGFAYNFRTMKYSIDDHIKLKRVSTLAVSPDGTWLAVGVDRLDRDGTKYLGDIWKLPLDGTAPTQLTRGESNDYGP